MGPMDKPRTEPPLRYPRKPPSTFRPKKQISLNFGPWEDRHDPAKKAEARQAVNQWLRR